MSAEPVLAAQGLTCCYNGRPVCERVDLEVEAGEIVGVCGTSGSGKTTLLRLLGGQERGDDGELDLGGVPILRAGRRIGDPPRAGYVMPVFQDPVGSLNLRWPVWRIITEPLMAAHRRPHPRRSERQDLAIEALARVGLGQVDPSARPTELSLGQCQRVSILRAVSAGPALILADEPTSALDVTAAAGVLSLLADLARSGTALVVVSHDEAVLDVLVHRTLRMDAARLVPHPRPGPSRTAPTPH